MQTIKNLTRRQSKLIRLCREKWYCRIQNLHFSNGEPSFRVPPRVEQKIRLGQQKKPSSTVESPTVTKEEMELLELIRQEEEGVILEIDVREGQPRDVKFAAEVLRD